MKQVEIITSLPNQRFSELAMNKAVELGFNCYSKPTTLKDQINPDCALFFFKWKGKLLAITIKQEINERYNTENE